MIDMVGKTFGRLFVLEKDNNRSTKITRHVYWKCLCSCGTTVYVDGCRLRNGTTKSCGCLSKDVLIQRNTTHNKTHTKAYSRWRDMLNRCYYKKHNRYRHYGGRGISVCVSWRESFENFYKDMGDPPEGLQLDRIDNDGNYEPSNCRWATRTEQTNNTTRQRYVNVNGTDVYFKDAKITCGIEYQTILRRLQRGWSLESAVTTPNKRKKDANNSAEINRQ